MHRAVADATPAADGGAQRDERLADALRSLADQLAATHDALGSLVSTVATPTVAAPIAAVPTADVPAGLTPHLRSVEALLAS